MKATIAIVVLVVLLACVTAMVLDPQPVYAQRGADKSLTGDKDLASKKGLGESLGSKKFDKDKLPGPGKIGLAIGSVIAAIAVVKFL